MKMHNLLIMTICLSCFISINSYSQDDFPRLSGPYLGQKTPGMVAEVFAPGIISKEFWELEGVFAPGMKEFYFTRDKGQDKNAVNNKFNPVVIGFRQENNVWKKFEEFKRKGEVTFSPDGARMYMAKNYKERTNAGWSENKRLGAMFDRKEWGIMRLSSSAQGTYVFDDFKTKDIIRISEVVNGERRAPMPMGENINTGKATAHPFIAPDESYIIWDSEREGGYGGSDLYISFKQQTGAWGKAINMGKAVNSSKSDTYASVTPDGKYILFNRKVADKNYNVDIYWVDAKIIDSLRAL